MLQAVCTLVHWVNSAVAARWHNAFERLRQHFVILRNFLVPSAKTQL